MAFDVDGITTALIKMSLAGGLEPPVVPFGLSGESGVSDVVAVAYYQAYTAYIGALSAGVVDGSDSIGSTLDSNVSSGSSASSPRAQARARWRANRRKRKKGVSDVLETSSILSVPFASVVSDTADGCYRKLLLEGAGKGCVTFAELLSMPRELFVSDAEMEDLRVCRTAPGKYHLGFVGVSAREVLGAVATHAGVSFPSGSLGADVPVTRVARGQPVMTDELGLPSRLSVAARLSRLTHVVVVDPSDPADFPMAVELIKKVRGFVGVLLVVRALSLNVVPLGTEYSRVKAELCGVGGMSHERATDYLVSRGKQLPSGVLDLLSVPVRRMLMQRSDSDGAVSSLYFKASLYRLQQYLSAAGIALDDVCFFDTGGRVCGEVVTRPVVRQDDYCMSMADSQWTSYQCLLARAIAGVAAGRGSPGVDVSAVRLAELERLARGEIVVPVVGYDEFLSAGGSKIFVVGSSSFIDFRQLLRCGVVRRVYAAVSSDRFITSVAPLGTVVSDFKGFSLFQGQLEQAGVQVALVAVEDGKRVTLSEFSDRLRSHGNAVYFSRWNSDTGSGAMLAGIHMVFKVCNSSGDKLSSVRLIYRGSDCEWLTVFEESNFGITTYGLCKPD